MTNDAGHLFLVNPNAGKLSLSKKRILVEQIAKTSNSRILITNSEEHAAQIARDAMLANDVVIACGGDGFQNIVAQQAVETGGVMSVLPLGRGNDFAASLQIRTAHDTELAIKNGVVHHARYINVEFSDYSRISLTCAGVGLLSDAAFRATKLPLLQGKLLYTVAALLSLVKLKCNKYTLALDDTQLSQDFLIFLGAASEYTGGGIFIAPNAKGDPSRMNVLYATSVGRAAAIGLLIKALTGKHLSHAKVSSRFFERCSIACDRDNFAASLVYGDGEYLGVLPANLHVGSRPLRVLVPRLPD